MSNTNDEAYQGSQNHEEDIQKEQSDDLEFHPIRINGEPMSETIIRERREWAY